jgi:hypothetical protein
MKIKSFSAKEAVAPVRFCMIEEKTSKPVTRWISGSFAEVSLEGMKITASMSEAEVETLVGRYVRVKVSFKLPGTAEAIAATGAIVYFRRGVAVAEADTMYFDISFVAIDYSTRYVIGEFINRRLNSPASNNILNFREKKIRDAGMIPQVPRMEHVNFAF